MTNHRQKRPIIVTKITKITNPARRTNPNSDVDANTTQVYMVMRMWWLNRVHLHQHHSDFSGVVGGRSEVRVGHVGIGGNPNKPNSTVGVLALSKTCAIVSYIWLTEAIIRHLSSVRFTSAMAASNFVQEPENLDHCKGI